MSSGIYIKGEKYLSSKDACAVSGYSKDELDKLCKVGKVRTLWFKDGYFIESRSLLACVTGGVFTDLNRGFFVKKILFFKKFGGLLVASLVLIVVLIFPLVLIEEELISENSLGYAPSTYNSTQYIVDKTGAVAGVFKVNDIIAELIEKGLYGIYDGISSFVK